MYTYKLTKLFVNSLLILANKTNTNVFNGFIFILHSKMQACEDIYMKMIDF